MSDARTRPSPVGPWATALLLGLPAAILALPSTLAFDPQPHASATGWAFLFALPCALWLPFAARRSGPLPWSGALLLAPLALTAVALLGTGPTDTFELRRAALLLLLSTIAFLGGVLLDRRGRTAFADLTVLLSLAFSAQALFGENGPAGPLGNTGTLSQAALPGAVIGAFALASGSLARRVLGGLAAAAFALHAGATPVLAGALALGLVLLLAFALAPRGARQARLLPLVIALLAPAAYFARPAADTGFERTDDGALATLASDTGGGAVRTRIWSRVPAMLSAHPWTGVGPGQFQATFPPHRDPAEIELSTHGRQSAAGVEVEHAHSDWIEVFVEYGLVGGLAFVALFALVVRRALGAFRLRAEAGADVGVSTDVALGGAALAVLANGALHGPLTYNPAAAFPAWVLFGALLATPSRPIGSAGRAVSRAACALLALVCVVTGASAALHLVEHGALLARRQLATAGFDEAVRSAGAAGAVLDMRLTDAWLEEGRVLRQAIEVAPDSALAHSLLARHHRSWRESDASRESALAAWRAVLQRRPYQVSALLGAGLLTGDAAERRALWERAVALDPGHPVALSNLARMELFDGDPDRALVHLRSLERGGLLAPALLVELGSRALIAGRTQTGLALLARADPALDGLGPTALLARSKQEEQLGGDRLYIDGLTTAAHRLWGLEHLEQNAAAFAVAQFRQALRTTRAHLPDGDVPTRLLLAASLTLANRVDDARSELEGIRTEDVTSGDWDELPELARAALRELGYPAPRRSAPAASTAAQTSAATDEIQRPARTASDS